MARTTPTLVQSLLGSNYGKDANDEFPDLQQFIDFATVIVDRVVTCAIRKGRGLTSPEAELMERYLAAHGYQTSDPGYTSRSTAGASGSFEGQSGMGLERTRYGQDALILDSSGCLANLNKKQRVTFAWLGKTPSERIPYDQRD
jgi:hypothetical protein